MNTADRSISLLGAAFTSSVWLYGTDARWRRVEEVLVLQVFR